MTATGAVDATEVEEVESFRLRARAWISENLPRLDAADLNASAAHHHGNADDERGERRGSAGRGRARRLRS